MRKWLILILSYAALYSDAQTRELKKAMSFYNAFTREQKVSDIEMAYDFIGKAMQDSLNAQDSEALLYQALIVKHYLDIKKPESSDQLVSLAAKSILLSYQTNKDLRRKDQILNSMKILGYDLYAEGIKQHKLNKHDVSYDLYKQLFQIQAILENNKTNFTIVGNSGEIITLSSKDMTNNMVIFCINSGKKEEAKLIFEREIQNNPSAISYARLIQLCYQLETKSEAQKYIKEGLSKYPNDIDLIIYSINSSLDAKEYDAALKSLNLALERTPSIDLYLVKSQTLESQDKIDEAIENYRLGIQKYPDNFDLLYGLGYSLLNRSFNILNEQNEITKPKALSMVKEAKEFFMKAKSIEPNKVDYEKIFEQINNVK